MPRYQQPLLVRVVPEPDEGVARVPEEPPEELRHVVGESELENEAPATDAELQGVRRVGGPLDAEADNEAVEVTAVNEERGGEPSFDGEGRGGDGDGNGSSEHIGGVGVDAGVVFVEGDFHSFRCRE